MAFVPRRRRLVRICNAPEQGPGEPASRELNAVRQTVWREPRWQTDRRHPCEVHWQPLGRCRPRFQMLSRPSFPGPDACPERKYAGHADKNRAEGHTADAGPITELSD